MLDGYAMSEPRYPYQRVLTDEEANLRTPTEEDGVSDCLFCRFYKLRAEIRDPMGNIIKDHCSKNHEVTDCRNQVCDEWRYVA